MPFTAPGVTLRSNGEERDNLERERENNAMALPALGFLLYRTLSMEHVQYSQNGICRFVRLNSGLNKLSCVVLPIYHIR